MRGCDRGQAEPLRALLGNRFGYMDVHPIRFDWPSQENSFQKFPLRPLRVAIYTIYSLPTNATLLQMITTSKRINYRIAFALSHMRHAIWSDRKYVCVCVWISGRATKRIFNFRKFTVSPYTLPIYHFLFLIFRLKNRCHAEKAVRIFKCEILDAQIKKSVRRFGDRKKKMKWIENVRILFAREILLFVPSSYCVDWQRQRALTKTIINFQKCWNQLTALIPYFVSRFFFSFFICSDLLRVFVQRFESPFDASNGSNKTKCSNCNVIFR